MRHSRRFRTLPAGVLLILAAAPLAAQDLRFPATRASDHVDVLHGIEIPDPYRWLEEVQSPETRAWIAAQNAVTESYLAAVPEREAIRQRLTAVSKHAQYTQPPRKEGGRYFYTENSGTQDQAVLYAQESLRSSRRTLLDPNLLSPDGTVSLAAWRPSPNGRLLAYALSTRGTDWREIRVRDVGSGRDLADTLRWIKFSSIAWTRDNRGFFYARFDEDAADELTSVVRFHKLYYHRIGTPQSEDVLVFERPNEPDWLFSHTMSDDGQYLVISIRQGTEVTNRLYFIDVGNPGRPVLDNPVVRLLDRADASYSFVGNIGPLFIIRTDSDAPRGQIVGIDINIPRREAWIPLVREGSDAIESAVYAGGHLIVTALSDAQSSVRIYSSRIDLAPAGSRRQRDRRPQGRLDPRLARGLLRPAFDFVREIPLPAPGTVSLVRGTAEDPEIFYDFVSFTHPRSIFRYDLRRDEPEIFLAPEVRFDPSLYETRQVFYTSRDGTRVPMFITMRLGTRLDGSNPTILHGYGGFNIAQKPSFSVRNLVWLEMGGIYALANIRGGSEYGRAWHDAGRLARKQNGFDDFIAAAEYLSRERYTSPARLAITGNSNGGLLVGAVLNQRPDLFAAALPAVGVMDMLRFHRFTVGWAWASDYGSPDDPDQFRVLYAYSPLHNIRPGTRYPATLVLAADHDDRVVPGHSFKYAAALQAAQAGAAPVLIRIETLVGHGAGTALSRVINESTDRLAFLVRVLGMRPVFGQ